jgi:hypothetical protein
VDLVELAAEPAGHACFHLADQPVRQRVLTLPYPLPYPLRYRCLDLPARAPPLSPAPEESAWPGSEPGDEEPPWAFDRTTPEADGTA